MVSSRAHRVRRLAAHMVAVTAAARVVDTLVRGQRSGIAGITLSACSSGRPVAPGGTAPATSALSPEDVVGRIRRLRATYRPGFAFPSWVVDHYAAKHFPLFEQDARRCAIFYNAGDDREVALQLATGREPVNIGMSRLYDAQEFERLCGLRSGAYGQLAEQSGRLPPNIAIMCPTPVVSGLGGPEEELNERQRLMVSDPEARLHVLNVIGYAFDSPSQPDQLHFLDAHGHLLPGKRLELSLCFERIFDKIFAATLEYRLEAVLLSKFGAGAFAANYAGSIYEEMWLPAFAARLAAWADRLRAGSVTEISMMGDASQVDAAFRATVEQLGFQVEAYGFFPDPLVEQLGGRLARVAVVNAWDCWSLIGNGNFNDNSLDGYVGRATALAVLGWPFTNPHLQDNMVAVPND